MRILHINTFDTGGAAIAAIRLHKALLSFGIESYMLFAKKTRDDIPNCYEYKPYTKNIFEKLIYRILRAIGYKKNYWERLSIKLQGKIKGFESFSFPKTDFDITSQKIYQEADIINLHWISSFVDYNFFTKNAKPIVWTLHDMNPFTGGCHNSMYCTKFQTDCNTCPQLKGTSNLNHSYDNLKYKQKKLAGKKIQIVCLSEWMLNYSKNSFLFKEYKHHRINHSIDCKAFKQYDKNYSRKVFNLPDDKTIILTISERFNRGKGSDILKEVVNSNQNEDIVFYSLGNSYDSNIINLGKIYDERFLALVYSAVDATLITSREENSPNLIPESFACGTPIIAFRIGGIPDHVNTNNNGMLEENISSKALLKLIYTFHENKNLFNEDEIRNYALKSFSPEIQCQKYSELYSKILSN